MSALAEQPTTARPAGPTGERVELARYTVPAGERILYGQRVDGSVRVTDVPLLPDGRAYLVERQLEQDGHAALLALVADYVTVAERIQGIPMVNSPLDTYVRELLDEVTS